MAVERDQEFVESIVKAIVTDPEAVKINRTIDEMGVLLELTVAKEDMAVIIGKEGRTVNALRTLLRVLGAKNDARLNLKIVEPEGSEGAPQKEERAEEAPSDSEEAPTDRAEEPVETDEEEAPMADLDIE